VRDRLVLRTKFHHDAIAFARSGVGDAYIMRSNTMSVAAAQFDRRLADRLHGYA